MKTSSTRKFQFGCVIIAAGTLLSSCVDPYAGGGQSRTVTTYSVGTEVPSLPPGHRREVIEGRDYYYSDGNYYRPQSGRYVIVEAPRSRQETYRRDRYNGPSRSREVIITELPRGYRTMERKGVRYYQANGNYYQRQGSGYIVVSQPY